MPHGAHYVVPAAQPVALTPGQQAPLPVHVQPAPAPQPVVISAEDVRQLQDMFPTLEVDVIKTILESERGNKDRAVNALLQMTADS